MRRQFNLIYLLLGGVHDVYLGAEYRWLKPNDLVIVPENMVYASSNIFDAKPGDVTRLPAGHDAYVIGDEAVVVIDFKEWLTMLFPNNLCNKR